jgi:hypothetical protein
MEMTEKNWREIAVHLYDELRVHGISECLANHVGFCSCKGVNCIEDFELADSDE